MRVIWSKRAVSQLRAAHKYIKGENPQAASEFVDAANSLAELLGEYPGMGVRTDEPGSHHVSPGTLSVSQSSKILNGEEIRIVRIRHASHKRPK
jgi:plasmid stabilization system protein ParE